MSTDELATASKDTSSVPLTSQPARSTLSSIPGILGIAGAVIAIALNAVVMFAPPAGVPGLLAYPQSVGAYQAGEIVFALTQLLMGLALLAMVRSRVGGERRIATIAGCLVLVGWAITVPGELILGVVAGEPADSDAVNLATGVYGIGVLLADIGLIVFGILALRARVWSQPWRALPLVLGAFQLLVVTPVLIGIGFIGIPAFTALLVADSLVALIGVALLRQKRTSP